MEIPADLETPVSAYLKTESPFSFLLESVEGGETLARYSFIGSDPMIVFQAKGNSIKITQNGSTEHLEGDPIHKLKELMHQFNPVKIPLLPRFHGGAVGYFGYDAIRYIEKIPNKNPDDLQIPDVHFMLATTIMAFDHIKHKIIIIANALVKDDLKEAYDTAINNIHSILHKISKPLDPQKHKLTSILPENETKYTSNLTLDQFKENVEKAKQYIYQGDIFQVVLSQRFSKKTTSDPFTTYRRLRMVNPSPYMFYLKFDDAILIGSSPEILVRLENNKATLRPIAGTRPRGATPAVDIELEKELLADIKENAEHIMLVDLGRNDLGRVCSYNSIQTTSLMHIERYSHVMHIASNIEGQLNPQFDGFDLLRACFPAGTVSGAPKIRAMEIIDELENTQRGHYAGAVGYFDFAGNMDTGIIIRTILIHKDTAYMQAGAGIVADSDPEKEYIETINKAKPLLSVC